MNPTPATVRTPLLPAATRPSARRCFPEPHAGGRACLWSLCEHTGPETNYSRDEVRFIAAYHSYVRGLGIVKPLSSEANK